MTNQQSSTSILIICILSSFVMIGTLILSIIIGPQLAHYLNLLALLFTFVAIYILIKNRLFKNKRSVINIVINLLIFLLVANLKYGYFDWEYVNLITLKRPN